MNTIKPQFEAEKVQKMKRIYKLIRVDGSKVEMSYFDICKTLGFSPETGFVEITNDGTLTFTVGRPHEIRAYAAAIKDKGFIPAKSLIERLQNM